ncbi:MAG TPA: hypothetical protein VFU15_12105 [Bacteroidia bacterium]|nr:hypothetical protein [Bacteroidia bacterium]
MKKIFALAALLLLNIPFFYAQDLPGISFNGKFSIDGNCQKGMVMSAHHDNNGKNYIYAACKESGLKIYNDSGRFVREIPIGEMNNLHVMNLSQNGNYLYLALGNFFASSKTPSGFAIVDVTNPTAAFVVSRWSDNSLKGGAGAVLCDGNYLFLGAMQNGILVFDISDRKNPVKLSSFIPNISFPDPKPDPPKYNARGLALRGNYLYVCYDAGGLRILDVSDKKNLKEVGRYSNPVMNGKPRAYNNVAIDSNYAYVAVDYCGMEVLDVSDPGNIKQVSWLDPWDCGKGGMSWFKSPGYANEIVLDKKNRLAFISAGRTPMIVADIADPSKPRLCATYDATGKDKGTWGVSVYDNRIYLTYVCAFVPFRSTWTGVEVIEYEVKKN